MKPRDDNDGGDDHCPTCGEKDRVEIDEHAGGSCPPDFREWCGTDHCHYRCLPCGRDWPTEHFDTTLRSIGWLWAPENPTTFLAASLQDARAARRAGEA